MAFPDDLSQVGTNMSPAKLARLRDALENDRDNIHWGRGGEIAGQAEAYFTYRGTVLHV